MALPTVSIIFPTNDNKQELSQCIDSIKKLKYPKNKIKAIIIENNTQGFAKAINLGVKKSKSDFVFVTNDDVVLEKNSIKNLVQFAIKNPKIGVLGGKIYYKNRPKRIANTGYKMNSWTGDVYAIRNLDNPDWVQGCAMMIPRKIIDKVGFFDESFSHFFEDFDYCLRVKNAGFEIKNLLSAKFWHGESTTGNKNLAQKYFEWYKNKIAFVLKNMPILNKVSILSIETFLVIPYRALILRDGRLVPFLKAVLFNLNKTHVE